MQIQTIHDIIFATVLVIAFYYRELLANVINLMYKIYNLTYDVGFWQTLAVIDKIGLIKCIKIAQSDNLSVIDIFRLIGIRKSISIVSCIGVHSVLKVISVVSAQPLIELQTQLQSQLQSQLRQKASKCCFDRAIKFKLCASESMTDAQIITLLKSKIKSRQ